MMNKELIDVSVYVLTYFHENYLKQALDSVLSQITKYSYEIVVSDDGSTDGTMDLLYEYQKIYPGIFRVYHNDENLGIPKNMFLARSYCKGRYIVPLAGDDYWIDNYKIEKQACFLDNHPEYVAVGNAMELRYDSEAKPFDILPVKKERNRSFSLQNYENGETLYTHGLMMRNFFLTEEGKDYFSRAQFISDKVDDAVDNVLLLKKGDVFVLDEISEVYRVPYDKKHSNNYNSKFSRLEKIQNTINLLNRMEIEFGHEINFKARYVNVFAISVLASLIVGDISLCKSMYSTIPHKYKEPIYKGVAIACIPKAIKFAINRILLIIKKLSC